MVYCTEQRLVMLYLALVFGSVWLSRKLIALWFKIEYLIVAILFESQIVDHFLKVQNMNAILKHPSSTYSRNFFLTTFSEYLVCKILNVINFLWRKKIMKVGGGRIQVSKRWLKKLNYSICHIKVAEYDNKIKKYKIVISLV